MPLRKPLLLWVSTALLVAATGCATPGAPQPPSLRIPQPVDNLAGERKGDRVILTWTQPIRTTDKQNIRRPGVTRICRAIGEFPMAGCREVIKQLSPAELTSPSTAQGAKPKVSYEDVLPQQVIGSQQYASYAVEVLNPSGKSAGLSNQVRIPLAPTLPPPADLRVDVTPSGPVLHWTGISRSQLGPSWQPYEYRYRIYRRLPGQPNYTLIDEAPLDGPDYVAPDNSFEWEKTYEYKVASVTIIPGSASPTEIEGDSSQVVTIAVHDVFPPARPTGLQAVNSGVGSKPFIDLSWTPNTESDLAGYIVYRHEPGQPPVPLNKELIKAPAYRDQSVQPGRTYYYAVQAVDERGNRSQPSEETSESVPKEQP
jgi:Fibronectin type III domain